jgi:hypothetical protein
MENRWTEEGNTDLINRCFPFHQNRTSLALKARLKKAEEQSTAQRK